MRFLEIAGAVTPDDSDYQITLRLAKAITGLELTYWNDSHFEELIERLSAIKRDFRSIYGRQHIAWIRNENDARNFIGKRKVGSFDRSELGNLGRTVKNKINSTFGNYGLAISYDEKVQIVLSVLEDLLEGNSNGKIDILVRILRSTNHRKLNMPSVRRKMQDNIY